MNKSWNYTPNNEFNYQNMRGRPRGGRGRGNRGNRGNWGFRSRGGSSRGSDGPRNRPNYGRQGSNEHWSQPNRNVPSKRLSEEDIGVTKYINEHEGFNGIIKTRFSDFQVSEINEKGEVAKLTDVSTPKVPKDEDAVVDEDLLLNKYNPEILPMETWDRINKVATSTGDEVEKIQVDVTGMTKEQRTKIHDAVKKAFGESIVGSTITVDDKKYVTFDKYRKGVRIDNRVKWVWPGEYVYFIVYKENCDTMEAASRIAERLRMQLRTSLLGYAGTKDRRAKTTQWFSLRKFDPRKIAAACRDMRDIRVGNYSFSDTHLRLGMLKGNQFRICLRNVTAPDARVDAACALLRERGFINYYGLQRFGTRIEVPTYEIGKKLLQGNFREAIKSILGERSGPMARALRLYHSESAFAALQALPPRAPPIETKLLQALARDENDLVGAMDQVARNARLLYIHSYQSWVWNRVVSERLTRLPPRPAPGDLVPLADLKDDGLEDESEDEENQNDDAEQDGAEKKTTDNKQNKDSIDNKTPDSLQFRSKTMIPVKVLRQEDCDSGKYSIFDVVMPLPGFSIEYPPNMRDYYEELLKKDELKLDMKHRYKCYSMCGGYRHVVARAGGVAWRCVRYSRPHADLLLSDADELEGRSDTGIEEDYSMCGGYRHVVARAGGVAWRCVRYSRPHADLLLSDADELEGRSDTGIEEDGKYKALLLTMTLPPSSYATMALRELLKVDTSGDNQALQNNYHQKTAKNDDQADQTEQKDDQGDQNEQEDTNEEECKDEEKGEKRKLNEDSEGLEVKRTRQSDDIE